MKVALINPAFIHIDQNSRGPESLGLLYLATCIEDIATVKIFDFNANSLNLSEVVVEILSQQYNIVGISVQLNVGIDGMEAIITELKKNFSGLILLGGNTATFLYKLFLERRYADIIIMNEGELTLREIVKNLITDNQSFSHIQGIAYRQGEIIYLSDKRELIPNIDDILFPNRKYYNEYYSTTTKATIITSRGCCYSCYYCSTRKMWGETWRARSAENIVREIEMIKMEYPHINKIVFADDNFMVDRERVKTFINLIRKKNIEMKFGFSARIELLDCDILNDLKEIGVEDIFMGIESGSTRILQMLRRNYTQENVIKLIDYAESIGIKITASFIVGLPFENISDVKNTLELIECIPSTTAQCHIFTPFPGTPCYENPEKFRLTINEISPDKIGLDSGVFIHTSEFNSSQITTFHIKALNIIRKKVLRRKQENRF